MFSHDAEKGCLGAPLFGVGRSKASVWLARRLFDPGGGDPDLHGQSCGGTHKRSCGGTLGVPSLRFIATSLHPPFLGLGRGWFVGNDGNGRSRIISSKHKGEHKACFHKGVGVVGGWCWRFVLACVRNREKSTGAGWVRGLSLLTELLGC